MARRKPKILGVHRGLKTGVFPSYDVCEPFVKGFPGACYKGFEYNVRDSESERVARIKADIYATLGLELEPGKYYAVVRGHVPGVYSSWPKAQEQVMGYPSRRRRHRQRRLARQYLRSFKTLEQARQCVADMKAIDPSEVFVAQSYFTNFRGFKNGTTGITFEPVDGMPFLDQFNALASSQGWVPGSQEYRFHKHEAIKQEFEFYYLSTTLEAEDDEDEDDEDASGSASEDGTEDSSADVRADVGDLNPAELARFDREESADRTMICYRQLCMKLGRAKPSTPSEAREILKARPWVNIIDLIDTARTGKPFETWNDFNEFSEYTRRSQKRIDLEFAKQHEFLSALLVDFGEPQRNESYNPRVPMKSLLSNSAVRPQGIRKRPPKHTKLDFDESRLSEALEC